MTWVPLAPEKEFLQLYTTGTKSGQTLDSGMHTKLEVSLAMNGGDVNHRFVEAALQSVQAFSVIWQQARSF
jgi:hypothetical protein